MLGTCSSLLEIRREADLRRNFIKLFSKEKQKLEDEVVQWKRFSRCLWKLMLRA